jgi:hypothetical protein
MPLKEKGHPQQARNAGLQLDPHTSSAGWTMPHSNGNPDKKITAWQELIFSLNYHADGQCGVLSRSKNVYAIRPVYLYIYRPNAKAV